MRCPQCGTESSEEYCPKCGHRLVSGHGFDPLWIGGSD